MTNERSEKTALTLHYVTAKRRAFTLNNYYMRLKQIKIAGFKSFVDPTTIHFPSNLVGVVGPNGCGKSNVIDATRWVMGEASAKYLRGDSKTDVIFNGSNARKPVGKASVELIFDNEMGKLGGEYASYAEISVRRELTRDGKSQFYLNGTKCRASDVKDLFLGTGLGPRSYAIIEQGTISRMIEAKPEELRVFIEEAAGISRYKKKRRETELRIGHTRDNLARLDDVRDELGKQLRRLDHQAKTAARYQNLKQEEQQTKAQLFALRWRDLDQEVTQADKSLAEHHNKIEAALAIQRNVEADIEKERNTFSERNESLNQIQAQFYAVGSTIARLEQDIQHQRETYQRQLREREQLQHNLQEITGHLGRDQDEISTLTAALAELEPALQRAQSQQNEHQTAQTDAENKLQTWQNQWEALQGNISQLTQTTEVERTRIAGLDSYQQQLLQRREQLQAEIANLQPEHTEEQLAEAEGKLEQITLQLESSESQLEQGRTTMQQQRNALRELGEQLNQQRTQLRQQQGRLASLEALQQAALGQDNAQQNMTQWLTQQGLEKNVRLAEQLVVEPGWELATETVLGHVLEAVIVDDSEALAPQLLDLSASVTLVNQQPTQAHANPAPSNSLLAKINQAGAAADHLRDVLVADDLAAALSLLPTLSAAQSVITPQGFWLGHGWVRQTAAATSEDSVLTRAQAVRDCQAELEALDMAVNVLVEQQQALDETVQQAEQQYSERQQQHNQVVQQQAQANSEVRRWQNQQQQEQQRSQRLGTEIDDIDTRLGADTDNLKQSRQTLQVSLDALGEAEAQRQTLLEERDTVQQAVQDAREANQATNQNVHNLSLQIETRKTRQQSKTSNLERLQEQQTQFSERLTVLSEALAEGETPVEDKQAELEEHLATRADVEAQLTEARQLTSQSEHKQRELNAQRQVAENATNAARGDAEQAKLARQTIAVRRQTINEQLVEQGVSDEAQRTEILTELPTEADVTQWDEQLAGVQRRIERLGPINLAAIEEHEQQAERKTYLDQQHADLNQALNELEKAIRDIDKETRTRFKDTYDQVNAGLGRIFPRMFGGGHAQLAKTEDDELTTGVVIQAQPPGKRNSSISQLSGGEKALTAAALVFAIFELNPAPFCMLDEVDAPLDDANAARLAEQVREMSKQVQFVFITHNKITMDLAEQLCGVTMREPGVSRLVSVDVDEAMKLAG